jgi:arginase
LVGILKVRPVTGVIWVDAHSDLNTPSIPSGSGNSHGMPLGLSMDHPKDSPLGETNFLDLTPFCLKAKRPRLYPDQLVYVGLRDVDKAECLWIRQLGIKAFTMTDRH